MDLGCLGCVGLDEQQQQQGQRQSQPWFRLLWLSADSVALML